ncbi:MAG: hypothetical protein NTX42_08355 [Methanothrix sp.]|nr:hypothetical protein [Methanothrix sp.]
MTQTKKPIKFISKEKGDIAIAVNGKEYSIDCITGEEITHQDYGTGSHGPHSIRNDIIGKLKIRSYLSSEEIKLLNEAIVFPELFEIKIKAYKTYHNCTKGAVHRPGDVFDFSGHF